MKKPAISYFLLHICSFLATTKYLIGTAQSSLADTVEALEKYQARLSVKQ